MIITIDVATPLTFLDLAKVSPAPFFRLGITPLP